MKKIIFLVLAVMLCSFVGAFAQETEVEEQTLDFDTVGEMISWSTNAEDIYNMLSEYSNVDISVEQDEQYGKTISATSESEDEAFAYVFYFDNDTEELWEVECVAYIYDNDLIVPAFQYLYESYGFESAEPYENEILAKYAADFDESYCVAGDGTIALLAASGETEDTYAKLALVLINREYFEQI